MNIQYREDESYTTYDHLRWIARRRAVTEGLLTFKKNTKARQEFYRLQTYRDITNMLLQQLSGY